MGKPPAVIVLPSTSEFEYGATAGDHRLDLDGQTTWHGKTTSPGRSSLGKPLLAVGPDNMLH